MVAVLSETTQVAVNPDVVACMLDGESALLDLENSRYYRLNAVGTHIWSALETPKSVGELQTVVTDAFDVDADRCARDVDALLSTLLRAGLVIVSDVKVP